MTPDLEKIVFDAQPQKVGFEWQVVAIYPNGLRDYITGFKDEVEAFGWIGSQRQLEWLRARGRGHARAAAISLERLNPNNR